MIAAFRKTPAWLALPALMVLAIAAACTLTGPMSHAASPNPDNQVRQNAADQRIGVAAPAIVQPPAGFGATDANETTQRKLGENIKQVSADQQGFEKVLNFLRDNLACNITVNWTALETRGIDKNTGVSIQLTNVPARKVLRTILDGVGGGVGVVDYVVEDGVITITCGDDLTALRRRALVGTGAGGAADYQAMLKLYELQRADPAQVKAAAMNPAVATLQGEVATLHDLEATRLKLERDLAAAQVGATNNQERLRMEAQLKKVSEQIQESRDQINDTQKKIDASQKQIADATANAQTPTVPTKPGSNRVYDVHDLLDVPDRQQGPLTSDQRNAMLDLVKTVTTLVRDPNYTISSFNGTLVISASDPVHSQIEELLVRLEKSHAQRLDILKARAAQNPPANTGPAGPLR